MAGKQTRGVAEAEADLFRDRPYVLSSPDAELEMWIQRMGARVVILDPEEHDRLVALTSHLPQLISTALAGCIAASDGAARVAGPAAIELTRLAMSPYEIWRDIFASNQESIDAALGAFIEKLQQLRKQLQTPAIEREFEQAAAAAKSLREK
jgi:prephenate dehydrogenase